MRVSAIFRTVILAASMAISATSHADVAVVEYRHSVFDHYFITPVADEIAKLDARVPPFENWSRTGRTFRAYESTATAGSVAICRFFNDSFAPKSSHFYAPIGLGCESTLANFPDWRLEDDKLFAVKLPDTTGACPAGAVPVYRLYNRGQGGAPNHRFVTSLADRQEMLDKGYVAEGSGIGVGMCVPSTVSRATAEGMWRGVTGRGQAVRMLILDDGSYYITYSTVGQDDDAGVVIGTSRSSDGRFMSSDAIDIPFVGGNRLLGGTGTISGSYNPGASLNLQYGEASLTASYDAAYDEPAKPQDVVGNYTGISGHKSDPHNTTASIAAGGDVTIQGAEFTFVGTATPRGVTNAFDIQLTGAALSMTQGIQYFDRARNKLYVLVPFVFNGQDVLFLIATRL